MSEEIKHITASLFRGVLRRIDELEEENKKLENKIDGLLEGKRAASKRIKLFQNEEDERNIKWLLKELESLE